MSNVSPFLILFALLIAVVWVPAYFEHYRNQARAGRAARARRRARRGPR